VHVFSGEISEIESHLETGSIRVLAVMSPEPLDGLLAGVPTATEQGYPSSGSRGADTTCPAG
jgi:putative tricarboxylic transport membrane protein